jgi:hypothetical protein
LLGALKRMQAVVFAGLDSRAEITFSFLMVLAFRIGKLACNGVLDIVSMYGLYATYTVFIIFIINIIYGITVR